MSFVKTTYYINACSNLRNTTSLHNCQLWYRDNKESKDVRKPGSQVAPGSPHQPSHAAPFLKPKGSPKQTETTPHHFLFLLFSPKRSKSSWQGKEGKLSWMRRALHIHSSFPQHFLHSPHGCCFRFLIHISSQNSPSGISKRAQLQSSGRSPESLPFLRHLFSSSLPGHRFPAPRRSAAS